MTHSFYWHFVTSLCSLDRVLSLLTLRANYVSHKYLFPQNRLHFSTPCCQRNTNLHRILSRHHPTLLHKSSSAAVSARNLKIVEMTSTSPKRQRCDAFSSVLSPNNAITLKPSQHSSLSCDSTRTTPSLTSSEASFDHSDDFFLLSPAELLVSDSVIDVSYPSFRLLPRVKANNDAWSVSFDLTSFAAQEVSLPLVNSKRSRGDDFVLSQKRVRYDYDHFGEVTCCTSKFPEVINVEDTGICVESETQVTSTPKPYLEPLRLSPPRIRRARANPLTHQFFPCRGNLAMPLLD